MKVKELIQTLNKCDQEIDVLIAYDSMVCRSDLNLGDICLYKNSDEYRDRGLYLCAGSANWQYDEGFEPVAK